MAPPPVTWESTEWKRTLLEAALTRAACAALLTDDSDDPLAFVSSFLAAYSKGDAAKGGAATAGAAAAAATQGASQSPLPIAFHTQQHFKARGPHPKYPPRATVTNAIVRWDVECPSYAPTEFTGQSVLKNARGLPTGFGWAHPEDVRSIREELEAVVTFAFGGVPHTLGAMVHFDEHGAPMNPVGRTGMRGRGGLGKWGPNQAADSIVTRRDPQTGALQFVAIKRGDTGEWALPGGMVDPGEVVAQTVRREFSEEAGDLEPAMKAKFNDLTDELFASGVQVYRGYVDDPRNTDNSWMETHALHFHCSGTLGEMLPLKAGDDARDVTWLAIDPSEPRFLSLYASHREWVERVAESIKLEEAMGVAPAAEPVAVAPRLSRMLSGRI